MSTLVVVLAMVVMAAALLVGAIVADRMLERRMARRRIAEETGATSGKRDAADAVIEILDRTGEAMRRTLQAAGQDDQSQEKST